MVLVEVSAAGAEGEGLTELFGLKSSESVFFAGDGEGVTVGETAGKAAAVVFVL